MILALLQAAAPCPAHAELTPAMRGWPAAVPVAASASTPPTLPIGEGVQATLVPAASLRLAVPTSRPAAAGSSAGLFAFSVATAGRYRVALGAGAWVDVVAGGHALTSVAHGHGDPCLTMRKYVDFDLRPGRHLLQITGATASSLKLMVTRLP